MEIKQFPRKLSRDATDRLLIQAADDSVQHIEAADFLEGIGGNAGTVPQRIVFEDQRTSGSNPEAGSSGAWINKVVNTITVDETAQATISSNIMGLPAGTWRATIHQSIYRGGGSLIRLVRSADNAVLVRSTNQYLGPNIDQGGLLVAMGRFSLTEFSGVRLQYRVSNAPDSALLLGVPGGIGEVEIYSRIEFEKLA